MEPARKFKIIVNSKECGTCSGATPSAVAKKVVKKLCGTSSKVVRFSLKECKRGCERVCGPYQGRMEKLDRPYKRGGKTITHRVVCGKVRKMRGGRDLIIGDFEKREDDAEFRIDTTIGIEPYIFFGSINYLGYDSYNYAIFCEKSFGGKVVIRENSLPLNELKLKDTDFITLLKKLRYYLNTLDGFRRIKSYLNRIIPKNGPAHVRENGPARVSENGPEQVSEGEILLNDCIKYSANYQFSGKIRGKAYNTNKLFRGNNRKPRSLYSYDPREEKYELLLTELDYLVNVNEPPSITYSGLFKLSDQHEPSRIRAGSKKIPITDIDHYLYCFDLDNFPKTYNTRPIYIKEKWPNENKNHNVDIDGTIKFPCWIIFKKKPS